MLGGKKGTGLDWMDLHEICTASVEQFFWTILRVKQNPWALVIRHFV